MVRRMEVPRPGRGHCCSNIYFKQETYQGIHLQVLTMCLPFLKAFYVKLSLSLSPCSLNITYPCFFGCNRPGGSGKQPRTAQLTIFYAGMVNVYDEVPFDKVSLEFFSTFSIHLL